jgi:hypothetical protein
LIINDYSYRFWLAAIGRGPARTPDSKIVPTKGPDQNILRFIVTTPSPATSSSIFQSTAISLAEPEESLLGDVTE